MTRRAAFDSRSTDPLIPLRAFDTAIECLLSGLLLFAPLAFGTTQAWSRQVFVVTVAVMAIVGVVKHLLAGTPWGRSTDGVDTAPAVWTWVYVPMGLFLLLCVAQSVMFPAAVLNAVSPGTLRLKTDLLSNLPSGIASLGRSTVSFYVYATRQQVVLVATMAVLLTIVIDVYREPARVQRLLAVIAAVGLVVAGLAAYQNLSGTRSVYGLVRAMHRNAGPFMNYSHFSQFINLSIGAAIAFLLVRLTELSDYYRTAGELWSAVCRSTNAPMWIAAGTCVLGPVTVFLCMSRMGMISMLAAAVVTGSLLARRGSTSRSRRNDGGGRTSLLVIVALIVFSVLLYVGFDTVYARLATVRNLETAGGGRTELLRDMRPLFRQFPLLGTGLGTYEFVFPLFDHTHAAQLATHAENEYAQLLEETGAAGLLMGALFVGWIVLHFGQAVRRPKEPIGYAAFGLGFGLLAILIHSGSDFGQHDLANAGLTSIFAGLIFNLSRRARSNESATRRGPAASAAPRSARAGPERRFNPMPRLATVAMLAAVLVGGSYAAMSTNRSRVAETAWRLAQYNAFDLEHADWRGSNADYIALLTPAATAAAVEPGNVIYRYWADVYRWHTIAHTVDPATGNLRLPAIAVPFAARIATDLESTRLLCPTYGPPLCVAGQIDLAVLHQPAKGRAEILEAARLTPYDKTVTYVAAVQTLHDHDEPTARSEFARYMALGGSARDVIDVLIQTDHPDLAYAAAGQDRANLQYLAGRMSPADPAMRPWIARCTADADRLLEAEATGPNASADSLAALAARTQSAGHPGDAIPLYQRALRGNYARTDWRLSLARCELAAGRNKDAARDARVVLQLRPQSADAQAIIDADDRTRP